MSLLQSNLRRIESSAVLPRGRLSCRMIGCWLVASAGCSFDVAPETGGRTDSMSAAWKPPAAASTDAAASSVVQAADSMRARSGSAGTASASMRPAAANTGAMSAHPSQARPDPDAELDAGEMQAKDAATRPLEPQQLPDASTPPVRCKPGVYTGTFSGSIQLIGLSLSSVTGTVRADLVSDATAEHLDFHDGHVVGVDQDGNRLTCGLAGRVNCADFQLEEGRLEAGIFHNLDSNSDTAFIGSAQAMYSQQPHSVVGTWQVEAKDSSLLGGRGTWSLILSQ